MAEITLITGDLTVSGSSTFLSNIFIPSGYTNEAFAITKSLTNQDRPIDILYYKSNGTTTRTSLDPLATGMKVSLQITDQNYNQLSRHIATQKLTIETGNQIGEWKESPFSLMNSTGVIIPYSSASGPANVRFKYKLMTLNERIEHIENSGVFALMPEDKIGFGTYTPQEKVHVVGNIRVQNTGYFNKLIVNNKEINAIGIGFILRDLNPSNLVSGIFV